MKSGRYWAGYLAEGGGGKTPAEVFEMCQQDAVDSFLAVLKEKLGPPPETDRELCPICDKAHGP